MQRFIFLILLIFLFGCSDKDGQSRFPHVSIDNLPEKDKLRMAIAKSIKLSFPGVDTMMYSEEWVLCSQSTQEEYERNYLPDLHKSIYLDVLKENYKGKFFVQDSILTNDFDKYFNKLDSIHRIDAWEAYARNKIDFSLWGEINSYEAVEIHERYSWHDTLYTVVKLFEFKNKKWNYKTKERSKEYMFEQEQKQNEIEELQRKNQEKLFEK